MDHVEIPINIEPGHKYAVALIAENNVYFPFKTYSTLSELVSGYVIWNQAAYMGALPPVVPIELSSRSDECLVLTDMIFEIPKTDNPLR